MVVPNSRPVFINVLSVLALSSLCLGSIAQAAQPRPPRVSVDDRWAEFTPPVNSDPDDDATISSTGTYFRPPSNPDEATGPRTSTGTRRGGCLGVTATAFTILGPNAPDTVLGQTISARPTFTWHLPETDRTFPVVFRLLAPDADNIPVPIYEATLAYKSGFMTYELPPGTPALATGVEYRWQVIIECNPEYPAQAMLQELSFVVVPTTAALSQALATATTDTERAIAYGQAGAWYDAIATVVPATTPTDQQTRKGLLIDLAAALPSSQDPLRQDILEIVETIPD